MSDTLALPQIDPKTPVPPDLQQVPPATLCDLLKPDKFGDIQSLFAQATDLQLTLVDAAHTPAELAATAEQKAAASNALAPRLTAQPDEQGRTQYVGPIYADGHLLGSVLIRLRDNDAVVSQPATDVRADATLMYQCVAALAQACLNEQQLRQRVEELGTLFELSTLLAGHHDLQEVLDVATRSGAEAMKVKAASIRLLDDETKELVPKAVHNLSAAYLNKGPIQLDRSELAQRALAGEVVYVRDMATDPDVLYPEDAKREGLVSILSTGMIYQGKPVGVIRLYTGTERQFTPFEVNLLRAIAKIIAAAITNTRLHAESLEAQRVRRQLRLAANVQRRMLPGAMPHLPPFDIGAQYVPSFELGGDFFDLIHLEGNLGVALGDVVGKGVAASLLMASVRASLRAYAQDVYDIDEVIARVNVALVRDTLDNEFATLFYGVLDPSTRRLTYCNAGHEPPLLLRGDTIQRLGVGGMIVGVDPEQRYDKAMVDLHPGDTLLIYSDGLSEAMNFDGEQFGKERIIAAMKQARALPAAAAIKHILWQMRCFTGLQQKFDDTTVVLIKADSV